MEAHDLPLHDYRLAHDPADVWFAFSPSRAMGPDSRRRATWRHLIMSRHNCGRSPGPWSKLKSRVEALFAPSLPLAIHCNVFAKVTKAFTFDEPRHWVMLGHGRTGYIIWDFPGPFLCPAPGKPSRSTRGPPLATWEAGYSLGRRRPGEPSVVMREYLAPRVSG